MIRPKHFDNLGPAFDESTEWAKALHDKTAAISHRAYIDHMYKSMIEMEEHNVAYKFRGEDSRCKCICDKVLEEIYVIEYSPDYSDRFPTVYYFYVDGMEQVCITFPTYEMALIAGIAYKNGVPEDELVSACYGIGKLIGNGINDWKDK